MVFRRFGRGYTLVRIGFVVEGYTERIILKSDGFREYLKEKNLQLIHEIIVAGSKDNLAPARITSYVQVLRDNGAEVIVVLRDLDDCLSIEEAKSKVISDTDIEKVIAVQAIESWFLADSKTLGDILNVPDFYFDMPEELVAPFEKLKELRMKYSGRGIGDKKVFARIMVSNGFSVQRAASHPNCPSAKYFLNKLESLAVN
ncbi:hypothetical protein DYBT9275_00689 [Dyadobacter sp. CECT 9275]|uniref:DUF4276 family protein n=1 Tax=Dyadobacter helix TaxID=2822344 RepID=A0A916J8V3_9BACT|nr:DUF4276 family protein [Dyadobacter sp. CECT 9275]CAG4991137.1 hypothetical protein DYBT9275_00689 [Dyadobacter sp. CECT 9275]